MSKPAAKAKQALTRKLGPLPVWAWAAAVLGVYLAYSRLPSRAAASQTTAVPVTGSTSGAGSAAQEPSGGGGGSPATNMPLDLLTKLFGQQAGTIDSLLSQVLQTQASAAASANLASAAAFAPSADDPAPGDSAAAAAPLRGDAVDGGANPFNDRSLPLTPPARAAIGGGGTFGSLSQLPPPDLSIPPIQVDFRTGIPAQVSGSFTPPPGGLIGATDAYYYDVNPTGTLDVSAPSIAAPEFQERGSRGSYQPIDG